MMTKHEIEIPDLPDGWRPVAYRNANTGEFVIGSGGVEQVRGSITKTITRYLIVEKIKPRRVVLEEISRQEYYRLFYDESSAKIYDMAGSYWKEIKEE